MYYLEYRCCINNVFLVYCSSVSKLILPSLANGVIPGVFVVFCMYIKWWWCIVDVLCGAHRTILLAYSLLESGPGHPRIGI